MVRLDNHGGGSQRFRLMSLEIPFDVDVHGCGELLGISQSEGAIICLIRLYGFDSWCVYFINGLDYGGENTVVAMFNQ